MNHNTTPFASSGSSSGMFTSDKGEEQAGTATDSLSMKLGVVLLKSSLD